MITMTGDFMPLANYRRHGFRIALGDATASEKCRFYFVGRENTQDAPDAGIRSVFGLGIFLMIHFSVLIGSYVLAALKIKAQQDRDTGIAGPRNLAIRVEFWNRHNGPPNDQRGSLEPLT